MDLIGDLGSDPVINTNQEPQKPTAATDLLDLLDVGVSSTNSDNINTGWFGFFNLLFSSTPPHCFSYTIQFLQQFEIKI